MKPLAKLKARAKVAARPGKVMAGAGAVGLALGAVLALAGKAKGPELAARALKAIEAKRQ